EVRNRAHTVLLLASEPAKTGKTRIIEQVLDEMGRNDVARESKRTDDFAGWKNHTLYRENGEL
ncbi:MAG: hypothetical protein K2O18_09125, partial [Oscillospiraceae bacterium]|nr:hypothetical protein [Oscillospiraceae bacterium]